jgi:hypothetical protein
MSSVAGLSQNARDTAGEVKALAQSVAAEAESLNAEVNSFLEGVRAA